LLALRVGFGGFDLLVVGVGFLFQRGEASGDDRLLG